MDVFDAIASAVQEHRVAELAVRLGLALALGAILGIDREMHNKAAGLRSHMLVSLASASFASMTMVMVEDGTAYPDAVRIDPVRVLQAVVAGVAFLGAGAIIQSRGSVHGMTTGASLWLAGAMGLASGLGQYVVAVLTAIFGIFVLTILGWAEACAARRRSDANADE